MAKEVKDVKVGKEFKMATTSYYNNKVCLLRWKTVTLAAYLDCWAWLYLDESVPNEKVPDGLCESALLWFDISDKKDMEKFIAKHAENDEVKTAILQFLEDFQEVKHE